MTMSVPVPFTPTTSKRMIEGGFAGLKVPASAPACAGVTAIPDAG